MPDSLPTPILNNTFTLTEFYRRAEILERFLEHLFFDKAAEPSRDRAREMRAFYKDANGEDRAHAEAVIAWGDDVLAPFNANNVYDGVRALKRAAESLPRLTLYVPVRFSAEQTAPIGAWCRAHIEQNIMLDIKVDPATVGGCAYAYRDMYRDFSLQYFVAKERDAFLTLTRTYGA